MSVDEKLFEDAIEEFLCLPSTGIASPWRSSSIPPLAWIYTSWLHLSRLPSRRTGLILRLVMDSKPGLCLQSD